MKHLINDNLRANLPKKNQLKAIYHHRSIPKKKNVQMAEDPRRSRINKKHLSTTEKMKTRNRSMQRGKILKLLDKDKKKNMNIMTKKKK